MALELTLRDTLRFDLEKSSIYKRANVRPVFGAEDEDIFDKVPDDTPIDFYDFSVMNALPFRSNGAYGMAEALPSRRHMTELAAEKLPELPCEFRPHFEPAAEFDFSLAFQEKQISRFTRDDDELWCSANWKVVFLPSCRSYHANY